MIFEVEKYKIELSTDVLRVFLKHKQIKNDSPEAGGILLGQVKGKYIYISRVTTPSYLDISSRYEFVRDRYTAQLIVNSSFYNSDGRTIYLGEWHTHPENIPSPSSQDFKMIKNQFRKNTLNEKFILMFIVGIKTNYISIYNGKNNIEGVLVEN